MNLKDSPTRVERFMRWAHNQPIIAAIVIVVGTIVGLGAVVGSIDVLRSGWERWNAPDDPRVFRYHDQTVRLASGNGMTFEQAIVVTGAFNTDAGIAAEYSWLERFYTRYAFICQTVVIRGNKVYDVFVLASDKDGDTQVHFDVTEFAKTPLRFAADDSLEVDVRKELYIPNPKTAQETNANRCATIQGAAAIHASQYEGGGRIYPRR